MKTGILLAIMAAGGMAFAQSSSTNLDSEVASTLQVQTSTETLPAAATTSTKKWGGVAAVMAATDVKDQQTNGSKSTVSVDNYLGVNYALNSTTKLEIGYNFSFANQTTPGKADFPDYYMGRDPQVTLKQSYGKIGNSDPITAWYSYYIPMGSYSQQVKGGNGTLRNDTFVNWNVRKFSFMPWISTRVYLGNHANEVNEALYRFNWGGSVTYNFSDLFNLYYWPQTNVRTTGLNRGKLTFNGAGESNQFQHEIGANYTVKVKGTEWVLNPAFVNYQNLSNGQGLGRSYYADAGSTVDSAEIDFNVWGSF